MRNILKWWFLAALAGIASGLMLTAGYFYQPLSILQLIAFVPLLFLLYKQPKITLSIAAGVFIRPVFILPQVITMHLPTWMTAILTTEITLLLVLLCGLACWSIKKPILPGCFAFGAGWMLLDWLNYTAIPIWGMAQTFARSWTAWPHLIAFIQWTGISGVLFVIGTLQALFVRLCCSKDKRKITLLSLGAVIALVATLDTIPLLKKPSGSIRVAAAGWTSRDSLGGFYSPDQKIKEFNALFAEPAAKAASEGAKIFASGEMAFDINENDYDKWISKFTEVARKNNLYLIVGYTSSQRGNCIFFMNPQGEVIADYLKTYLSPPEWGNKHGNGDLKVIRVDGVNIGGMICHDDNYSRLTRFYGRLKTPLIFSPSWDWEEVKNEHLAAVRARAIECHFGIARSTYHGIAAIISPNGDILAEHDTGIEGPGVVIADCPLYQDVTFFASFGETPTLIVMVCMIGMFILQKRNNSNRDQKHASPDLGIAPDE